MKKVQDALKDIGIPVIAGIWKATDTQKAPDQYVVYSTTTTEARCCDDSVVAFRTYVYLDLWSNKDPTEMRDTIRSKMYAAGFGIVEETDKGYNRPAYNWETNRYTVQWTFCIYENVDPIPLAGGE